MQLAEVLRLHGIFQRLIAHLRRGVAAYLVLITALVPTVIVYLRVQRNADTTEQLRFAEKSRSITDVVQKELDSYAGTLRSVAGLFEAGGLLEPQEWMRFVGSMDLEERHPGMGSIGFAPILRPDEVAGFSSQMKGLLGTNLVIQAAGGKTIVCPTLYLEEFGGDNDPHHGWDAMSDPKRALALMRLLDKRVTVTSGPHSLETSMGQFPGFISYVPVFGRSTNGTPRPLKGVVFSSFIPQQMFATLKQAEIDKAVRAEMYLQPRKLVARVGGTNGPAVAGFSTSNLIHVFDQRLAIELAAMPSFKVSAGANLPRLTLYGGIVFSFLLFAIAWTQVAARSAAERLNRRLLRSEENLLKVNAELEEKVSEQKRTEDLLAHERELLRSLLDNSPDRIYFKDRESRFIKCGKTVAERIGFTDGADAVGKTDFDFFSEEHARAAFEAEQEIIRTGKPLVGVVEKETWHDGRVSWVLTSKMPLRDKHGNIIGTFGTSKDITALKETEAELLRASKLESVGVLAGGIAHDFNNILTVILGNISLARMLHDGMPQQLINVLTEAEKASLRARDLTQRLLTFAKGGAPIRRTIQPGTLLRDCTKAVLQGTNVQFEFFIADDLWSVNADDGQLAQVFHNLLQYARHAVGENPAIDVYASNHEIEAEPLLFLKPGRYVRVSIRDHGAGLAPEQVNNIFDPYFSSKKQGSGLELATAYSIIRKHEGQIRVESISGQGTVFHVYIPAAQVEVAPAETSVRLPARPARGRVLVMDDEAGIRNLATVLLRKAGYTPDVAIDGAEAISKYDAARQAGTPFDAVIMDLTIPNGMGGVEAMRQIRNLDPSVKAIVSSGYSNDPVMANYRDYGFAGVVPKPYGVEDLAMALGELLAEEEPEIEPVLA